MSKCAIEDIFCDEIIVNKIQKRLPYLFQIAELESMRGGKIGMEVGSVREKIIIALLIYKFGEGNVEEINITESEVDVKIFNKPISIKTITGSNFSGVKLIWTVDSGKAKEFAENYFPGCDILLVQINWGKTGGFYYIPYTVQSNVFKHLGREKYIKLPKAGTNPRGVEISKEALKELLEDKRTKRIMINWIKKDIAHNPLKRWIDLWKEE